MKPDKALALVHRYSELTWIIRAAKYRIAESLDKCAGLDGKRLERRKSCETDPWQYVGEIDSEENEKRTHLREWYRPEAVEREWGPPGQEWNAVGDSEREECPHCFAAHTAVQDRKAARKALGAVKAAMTCTTAKPAILSWRPDHGEDGAP
jgi:hypothetical protein